MSNPSSSTLPSRTSTPVDAAASRFTTQAATAEDILKSQTVGLVQLSDFRKRRAEALELQDRGVGNVAGAAQKGAGNVPDGASIPAQQPQPAAKRKRRNAQKGKLSFALDDDDDDEKPDAGCNTGVSTPAVSIKSCSNTAALPRPLPAASADASNGDGDASAARRRRLGPNASLGLAPHKARTKHALMQEAQTRSQLRKEFAAMRDAVRATEIALPFVFYDGADAAGGTCRVKKGEHVWLFLDKARKVGAELAVSAAATAAGGDRSSRREWARVSVDDLMLVRDDIILPHHYEFYHFFANGCRSYNGRLFEGFLAAPTAATPIFAGGAAAGADGVAAAPYEAPASPGPGKRAASATSAAAVDESQLEGHGDDPSITKVVDRRWYERNKHIYPASAWEEFDADKDYTTASRRDAEGNAFFFS